MTYHSSKQIYYLPRSSNMRKPAEVNNICLSKGVEGFLLACEARELSSHTIADYSHTLRIFQAHVGDIQLYNIQPPQVDAFMAAQKVSAKTKLNYHIGLSAFWTWAVKYGYTPKHIMRAIEAPRPKKVVIHPLSEVEVRAMFNGLRTNADRDRVIMLILMDTGMRASELCELTVKSISMTNKQIKLTGKGNKERLLPFSSRTATALFKYLASLPEGAERPFEFSRTSLGRQIRRIGDRVGVEAHPHRFRHTFAVNFLRNGGDPYTLQEMLGHSTMEMVRKYLEIAQVDIDAAHKKASPVEHWKL